MLTISTTARPATDLGYLLHKHPDRVQEFGQSFGIARVVYPEADENRCTAALLLDIDPIALARRRGRDVPDYALGQYVNDRPYAASSLLAVALGTVFRTARSGRCDQRPELASSAMPLEIAVPALPCRGGADLLRRLFEPLGWTVEATPIPVDELYPQWGESRYVRAVLRGTLRLADALNQLYVLLPVLDDAKHYWVGTDEIDKLIRAGAEWLAAHPEKELIAHRFLRHRAGLARVVLERLAEVGDDLADALDPAIDEAPARTPLHVIRRETVLAIVDEIGAASVIDLGCGSGQLVAALQDRPAVTTVTGVDVSVRALAAAAHRVRPGTELFQGSLTYTDARYNGYDAAVMMEVIEHIDPPRLAAVAHVVFGTAAPTHVIVTTPNSEYNTQYPGLTGFRHPDHRFEWDRAEFATWADHVGERYGYRTEFRTVGDVDPEVGAPTQLALFTKGAADD